MSNNRIFDHPVLGSLSNQTEITFTFNGKKYTGFEGDTIASALLANRIRHLRVHEETGAPRGIYCNIGHCFECRVTVDGSEGVRACMTPIKSDMAIESGQLQPNPLNPSIDPEDLPRTYTEFLEKSKDKQEDDPNV